MMTYQELIDLLQRMIPDQLNEEVVINFNNKFYKILFANVIINDCENGVPYLDMTGDLIDDD